MKVIWIRMPTIQNGTDLEIVEFGMNVMQIISVLIHFIYFFQVENERPCVDCSISFTVLCTGGARYKILKMSLVVNKSTSDQ